MTNTPDALADLLAQEIEAYSQLLQVERDKEQAITAAAAAQLLDVLRREEQAAARAAELERRLLHCRDEFAAQAARPAITLREIATLFDPHQAARIESLRTRLFGLAEEIRKINQTNYLLLKQSIELLDEVVSALLGDGAPCNTYGDTGRIEHAPAARASLSLKV